MTTNQNGNGSANRINDESVILAVIFHKPGMRRKGDMSKVTTEADEEMLHLSKDIIDSVEYQAVCSVGSKCRREIERLALPSPLRRGTYRIPVKLLDRVYSIMEDGQAKYLAAKADFLAAYPQRCQEAKDRLKDQWVEANYPPPERIEAAIWPEWSIRELGLPDGRKVGEVIREAELRKIKVELAEEADQIKAVLRDAARQLFGSLRKALGRKADGSRNQLRDDTYGKLIEFLGTFDARNLADDGELKSAVDRCRDLLDGRTADDFREDEGVREYARAQMDEIGAQVEALAVAMPRRITFED